MSMLKTRLLLSMLWLSIAPTYAASFDCVKASTSVEQAICRDGYLSSLDEILASTYQEAWGLAHDQQGLKQSQREWLVLRDQCPDINCITESIQQRNQELRTYVAALKEEASKQVYATEVEAWAAEEAAKRAALIERQAAAEKAAKIKEQEARSAELEEAAAQELIDAAHAEDYAEHAYIRETMPPKTPHSDSLNWGYWWVGVIVVAVLFVLDRVTRFLYPGSSSSSSSSSRDSLAQDIDDDVGIIARTDSNELPRLQQSTYRVGVSPIANACGSCRYWGGYRFSSPKLGNYLLVKKGEKGNCTYKRPGSPRLNLGPTDGKQCRDRSLL